VARFADKKQIIPDKKGNVLVEFGAIGFHGRERCAVSLFSDDEELVGGSFSTVESGFPRPCKHATDQYEFWTNDFSTTKKMDEVWKINNDFTIFMAYTYNGEYDIVRSTLTSALNKYYFELGLVHSRRIQDDAKRAIDYLSN
jgi:hypothetical protein